jgi:hypothetical protein
VYVDSAHTAANFGKLRVVTSAEFTDQQQMRAAGWLEGYLTAGEGFKGSIQPAVKWAARRDAMSSTGSSLASAASATESATTCHQLW